MTPIRFVCGTRKSRVQFFAEAALGRSLTLYPDLSNVELQLFDNNRSGLPTIYNVAIDYAIEHPARLIFIHDDVWLNDFFWRDRIEAALQRFDIVGVAGNMRRVPKQPSWAFISPDFHWDERRFLSGVVGHGEGFPCNVVSTYGAPGRECKLLDGLLLIADSKKLIENEVRFDEQFEFHFYDMDFCRQAELTGLAMGTWPLSVIHESGGAFNSPAWRVGYERYLRKYGE